MLKILNLDKDRHKSDKNCKTYCYCTICQKKSTSPNHERFPGPKKSRSACMWCGCVCIFVVVCHYQLSDIVGSGGRKNSRDELFGGEIETSRDRTSTQDTENVEKGSVAKRLGPY